MKKIGSILFAGLLVSFPLVAMALPGQQYAAAVARMKALQGFHTSVFISELGNVPTATATRRYKGHGLGISTSDAVGHRVYSERIWYDAPNFSFDHRNAQVGQILTLLYDPAIASDFLSATLIARVPVFYPHGKFTIFYRGAQYGYQINDSDMTIFERKSLDHEIANAKECAKHDCGD